MKRLKIVSFYIFSRANKTGYLYKKYNNDDIHKHRTWC